MGKEDEHEGKRPKKTSDEEECYVCEYVPVGRVTYPQRDPYGPYADHYRPPYGAPYRDPYRDPNYGPGSYIGRQPIYNDEYFYNDYDPQYSGFSDPMLDGLFVDFFTDPSFGQCYGPVYDDYVDPMFIEFERHYPHDGFTPRFDYASSYYY